MEKSGKYLDEFSRRKALHFAGVGIATTLAGLASGAVSAVASPPPNDVITIYHLEGRRSFRIVWLCEELGLPYKLMFKQGDFKASADMLHAINPLVPMWPTAIVKGHVMVESGAIVEYILSQYGKGRLVPAVNSEDYAFYLQFLHFAEGTAMFRLWAERYAATIANIPIEQVPIGRSKNIKDDGKTFQVVGTVAVLEFMDDFLSKHPYFGGKNFSAADLMMDFFARGVKLTVHHDSMEYPNIAEWRRRVETRPAFIRANDIAVPQGWDEYGLPKGMPLPFAPPPDKPGVPKPPNFDRP